MVVVRPRHYKVRGALWTSECREDKMDNPKQFKVGGKSSVGLAPTMEVSRCP